MNAAKTAFAGLIDYAGLYPPASLPLDDVVRRFATYRRSPHAWLLGRLIVPVEQLAAASDLAAALGASSADRWPVSVLVGDAAAAASNASKIVVFSSAPAAVLQVDAIEATASTPEEIARLADAYPVTIERFVEIPSEPDPTPLIHHLARAGCSAKIRTGGITADRFPATAVVARFLARASTSGVAMKATAGLHHAQRGQYPLTYADDSPTGTMHGFVNLTFAAALLAAGKVDESLAGDCLDDDRPGVFKFGGRAGSWLNGVLTYGEFAHARRVLLRSVGSCSFEEPLRELLPLL